jgi:hypothetical protein
VKILNQFLFFLLFVSTSKGHACGFIPFIPFDQAAATSDVIIIGQIKKDTQWHPNCRVFAVRKYLKGYLWSSEIMVKAPSDTGFLAFSDVFREGKEYILFLKKPQKNSFSEDYVVILGGTDWYHQDLEDWILKFLSKNAKDKNPIWLPINLRVSGFHNALMKILEKDFPKNENLE